MAENHSSRSGRDVQRIALIAAAAFCFALCLLAAVVPTLGAAAISSVALLALGGALYFYTSARVGAVEQPRLGGRAQQARRRYLTLAAAATLTLFIALVFGTLASSIGALWQCLTWPDCAITGDGSQIALLHRGLAALTTLLIAALAIITWRTYPQQSIRHAAGWALTLMLLQNAIGLAQVVAARDGTALPVAASRGLHLAVGALTWMAVVVLGTLALRLPYPAAKQPEAPAAAKPAQPSKFKDYLSLTKPGVISLLILTTITSMFITPAGVPALELVIWTFIGGWLMASGAHSINCYLDRDVDINMGRTARRPIPSGRIPAWHALVLGVVLGALAFTILSVFANPLTAWLALAGYGFYVLIYTFWLKRNSPSNIVIGGAAGAFPPLVGWAAASGQLSWAALLLFLIIFYWTPPHFWALALIREQDYARAGVPMLPVVAGAAETRRQILLYSIQMLVLTLIPALLGILGMLYLASAVALGAVFMYYALRLHREGSTASAWGLYKFSLLYLALLFVAMVVDRLWLS